MSTQLPPYRPLDATRIELSPVAVAADQVIRGEPTTASVELGAVNGASVGVWEMSEGGMTDVEADEYFIVISGRATIVLLDDGAERDRIELRPGIVCRLAAGSTTRWDVWETLRKLYILADD